MPEILLVEDDSSRRVCKKLHHRPVGAGIVTQPHFSLSDTIEPLQQS